MSEGSSSREKECDDFLVRIDEELTKFDEDDRHDRRLHHLQLSDFPDGQLTWGGEIQLCRIGPYYYPTERYELKMVKYKYLKLFPKRRNETSVERYFIAMTKLLQRATKCYTHTGLSESEFLEMMVVDSCFIVELFRKYTMQELREEDDPIFSEGRCDLYVLARDLFSPRNQLPFFVLVEFFNMAKIQDDPRDDLIDLALNFFGSMIGCTLKASDSIRESSNKIKHLVSLVYDCLCLSLADKSKMLPPVGTRGIGTELELINYASELLEAGVSFKKIKGRSLVEIDFGHGVLRIPPLKFSENTWLFIDILLEYESLFPISLPRYVSDYVKFMQCLVNSTKDVEVLRQSGVIENWWGNDEMILKKISNMNSSTVISGNFTYSRVLSAVNEHCRRRRNVWMAKLWSNYFNSPWSLVSFIAAVVLLLLTLTQTVFAILSYHPS